MKKTEIPINILNFGKLQDIIPVRIPKGFDKTYVLSLYHLIKTEITSIDDTNPLYNWLEKIIEYDHMDALIFLLQTQKLVEEKIQDTLG